MKPIFKCEYCNFMGIEDVVKTHEESCIYNGEKKDCTSCKYADCKWVSITEGKFNYICKKGKNIPEGKQFLNCDMHETRDSKYSPTGLRNDNPFSLF